MDIILLQDIEKVGEKHTIVTVKPGYARNFLIPQGMAIVANETNRGRLDELRRRAEAGEAKKIAAAQEIAAQLEGKTLKIGAKAGTSGKIFGSVTNIQIAAALQEQLNIDVDRKSVVVPDEVKELGSYTAAINLHKEVEVKVNFEVVEDK
ncbi:MAG: 50S ribosomal protein L9 [Saprospiraceae bacterium]|nr:50S ribosomal protein L9 [Saprospiraceae bacterium]